MNYFSLPNGIYVANNDPIDGARYIADTTITRDSLVTNGRAYDGLQVYVTDVSTLYILTDLSTESWDEISFNSADLSLYATLTYVDGSLATRDASITSLFTNKVDQSFFDSSIAAQITWDTNQDASIDYLFGKDNNFDTSLNSLWIAITDVSTSLEDYLPLSGGDLTGELHIGADASIIGKLTIDGSLMVNNIEVDKYIHELSAALEMPYTVGGITATTTAGSLLGKTSIELWNELLFPTVLASIGTNNSGSFTTGLSTSTVEVGTTYTPTITAIYNPGVITDGDGTTGPNLTGDASAFHFRDPDGTPVNTTNASGNSQVYGFAAYNINFNSNNWSVLIDYLEGTGNYYDNKGILGSNLDSSRLEGNVGYINSNTITGRRYGWYGSGITNSTPVNSAEVRALSDKIFLSSTNTGSFNIEILAGDPEVYFYIPTGKNVSVKYVQSSNADVTDTFLPASAITVNDAAGVGQSFEKYSTSIGTNGYLVDATYAVTIS